MTREQVLLEQNTILSNACKLWIDKFFALRAVHGDIPVDQVLPNIELQCALLTNRLNQSIQKEVHTDSEGNVVAVGEDLEVVSADPVKRNVVVKTRKKKRG